LAPGVFLLYDKGARVTSKKVTVPLGVVGVLALVLSVSACGGESLAGDSDGGKSGDVTFMPVPDEEKAKDAIEAVKTDDELNAELPDAYKNGKIKWTTSVGYPPMEIFGSDGESIIGVDPAIAHALSRKLGLEMSIADQDFNTMIPGLISGRFDALASSMTDNEARQETTTFVDYVKSGQAFLVKEGNPLGVKTYKDLCGHTVAMVDSGSSAELAHKFADQCKADGLKELKVLPFEGDQEANLSLESGRADATLTDYPVAAQRDADDELEVEMVVVDGDEALWGIGVDNDNKELAKVFQKALQELIDDGTYKKILHAWNVDDMAIKKATINEGP
jgi:polar amino acid transport system substrate-binding protein